MGTKPQRPVNYGIIKIMSTRSAAFLLFPAFILLCSGVALAAKPAAPRLMLPAACTPGQDCWIVNQVDMNPAEGVAEDFTCGSKTYDGHEGTDFGLRDAVAMKTGVSVLAAAPGKVARVRDAMPDHQPTPEEMEKMLADNKGCGNGVLIDHGNGWQSIYCHLKAGSVLVKPEMQVTAGQKLADIGQSGAAEFPHVHFGLFHDNATVDPFSGTLAEEGCGKIKGAMWDVGLSVDYDPMTIFISGFDTGVPDFNKIRADSSSPASTGPAIDALVYWVGLYGMHQGDRIKLDIIAPDGSVFATQSLTQETDRARQYYYVGRRVGDPLLPGQYKGVAVIERPIAGSETETLTRRAEKEITVTNPLTQDGSSGTLLP